MGRKNIVVDEQEIDSPRGGLSGGDTTMLFFDIVIIVFVIIVITSVASIDMNMINADLDLGLGLTLVFKALSSGSKTMDIGL